MTALKTRDIDAYFDAPALRHRAFLVYGPDAGLVAERADALQKRATRDEPSGIDRIRLASEDLRSDPGRLADEAGAQALFGGTPLIRLSLSDARHNVVTSIEPLLKESLESFWLIVQAGELRPTSPVRKLFEASDTAVAIPCYLSDSQNISRLADEMIRSAGNRIDPQALGLVADCLGADRLAARREIEKLILFAGSGAEITLDHVRQSIGENRVLRNDRIIDAAMLGRAGEVAADLRRLTQEQASPTALASQGLRFLISLQEMRQQVEEGRRPGDIVARARPPIFFDRRRQVEEALRIWPLPALRAARNVLAGAIRGARNNPGLEQAQVSNAIIRLAARGEKLATGTPPGHRNSSA